MKILKYFFSFEGRMGRLSFFIHGIVLFGIFLGSVFGIDALKVALNLEKTNSFIETLKTLLGLLLLVIMISGFSSTVRRLHDLNRSGWALLWSFMPFANIWLFIQLYFIKGTTGANRFGSDPAASKEAEKEIKDERFINRERSQSKERFDRN